jgi:hypothetical protein
MRGLAIASMVERFVAFRFFCHLAPENCRRVAARGATARSDGLLQSTGDFIVVGSFQNVGQSSKQWPLEQIEQPRIPIEVVLAHGPTQTVEFRAAAKPDMELGAAGVEMRSKGSTWRAASREPPCLCQGTGRLAVNLAHSNDIVLF